MKLGAQTVQCWELQGYKLNASVTPDTLLLHTTPLSKWLHCSYLKMNKMIVVLCSLLKLLIQT